MAPATAPGSASGSVPGGIGSGTSTALGPPRILAEAPRHHLLQHQQQQQQQQRLMKSESMPVQLNKGKEKFEEM